MTTIRDTYAKAVALYEKGVRALQRHHYEAATAAFHRLFDEYPDEHELHDRARLYLNICERNTGPTARPLKNAADRMLAATLALNRGEFDDAQRLLHAAAAAAPRDGYVQYMLALTHAQREDAQTAAQHLTKAIALDRRHRVQAEHDPDFDTVRTSRPFREALAAR